MPKHYNYTDKPDKDLWKKQGFRSPQSFEKFRFHPDQYGQKPEYLKKPDYLTKKPRRKKSS